MGTGIAVSCVYKNLCVHKNQCAVCYLKSFDLGHNDICFLFLGLPSINNAFTNIYELIQLVMYLYLHVSDVQSSPEQLGKCSTLFSRWSWCVPQMKPL